MRTGDDVFGSMEATAETEMAHATVCVHYISSKCKQVDDR